MAFAFIKWERERTSYGFSWSFWGPVVFLKGCQEEHFYSIISLHVLRTVLLSSFTKFLLFICFVSQLIWTMLSRFYPDTSDLCEFPAQLAMQGIACWAVSGICSHTHAKCQKPKASYHGLGCLPVTEGWACAHEGFPYSNWHLAMCSYSKPLNHFCSLKAPII